jgi:transcriptional antiterminator NusG
MGMENEIFRVLVPMEDEVEYKDGKKKITKRKVFPGYVLVEMIVNDRSWYVVRNTPGVTGFVGSGSKPIPLDNGEAKQIIRQLGGDEVRTRINFSLGENIRVINGPFENFIGVIDEINLEKGKMRVIISMFGRETPIELDFAQIEKIS